MVFYVDLVYIGYAKKNKLKDNNNNFKDENEEKKNTCVGVNNIYKKKKENKIVFISNKKINLG